jgi:hypothetical protein
MIGELEEGRERLLSEPSLESLLSNLRRKLQSITRNIYIFDWIPEQTEDLYRVLVDGTTVVHIEIPHDAQSGEVLLEKWSVEEYLNTRKKRLTGLHRRKFEIALRLAERRA